MVEWRIGLVDVDQCGDAVEMKYRTRIVLSW